MERLLTTIAEPRYAALGAAWIAWCVLHSVTIAWGELPRLQRRLGRTAAYYRLVFNGVAIISLVPVVALMLQLRGPTLVAWSGLWRLAQAALLGAGVALFVAGAQRYDLNEVLGLNQIERARPAENAARPPRLRTTGVLGITRHPWYLGGLLVIWARDLDAAGLVTNAVLTVYLFVGTALEERKLVRVYGDAYRRYQRRVSMLLPIRWLRTRGRSDAGDAG
jgi:protein-S-isoprenylcysteine O-methyltransferase Ste14